MRPVYKNTSDAQRYLQMAKGGWDISLNKDGSRFGLKQQSTSQPFHTYTEFLRHQPMGTVWGFKYL